MFLGIDLGTTNTVVARSFMDVRNQLNTEIVQIGQIYDDNWEKFPTLPSMVYFCDDDKIVGREAKRQRNQDKRHVVTNSKRFMGTNKVWEIDGIKYEAMDIAAIILQHCIRAMEKGGNMKYDTVVITVPASFNPEQIADTLRAAKKAGFKDEQVIIKHEPTAALLSFIHKEAQKHQDERYIDFSQTKRILVFDLGGGTCDTSVIDVLVEQDEMHFTELGIGRYQELGGIDFDTQLAEGLLQDFYIKNDIKEGAITEEEQEDLFSKLQLAAEILKEKLSSTIENKKLTGEVSDIDEITVKYSIPQFYQNKPYRITISKKEYDQYTNRLYKDTKIRYKKFEDMDKNKNIIGVIRKTLEDYDIPKNSIDYVFMTGGMSKFPTVQEKVSEFLNKPVIMPENPMEAVAEGASIYQYYKIYEQKKVLDINERLKYIDQNIDITDYQNPVDTNIGKEGIIDNMMLAEAVLLDVDEGLPKVIIPKKTVVPYSGAIRGAFRTTSPAGVKLNIYAAEDAYDSSMRVQKSLEKEFEFPVPSGTPFDIEYHINENKAISMKIIIDDGIREKQELELSIYSDINVTKHDYSIRIED